VPEKNVVMGTHRKLYNENLPRLIFSETYDLLLGNDCEINKHKKVGPKKWSNDILRQFLNITLTRKFLRVYMKITYF
jgi:hypothetical protein